MRKILNGAVAALAVSGMIAASAAPALAQEHGHGGGGGHWSGGGGHWNSGGFGGGHAYEGGRGGWGGGYHYGGHGYRGGYYGGDALAAGVLGLGLGAALAGGYGSPYYYDDYDDYGPACHMEMRWDPRWGGYERVRVCY